MNNEKSLEQLLSELSDSIAESDKIREECSLKYNTLKKALIDCYGNNDFSKDCIDKICMDVQDLATVLSVLKLSSYYQNNVNNTRLDNDGLSVFLVNSICGSDIKPITTVDLMDTAETLFIDGYIDDNRSNTALANINNFVIRLNFFLDQYKFTMEAKNSIKVDASNALLSFAQLLLYICRVSEEKNPNPSRDFLQGIYDYLKTQLDFISACINDPLKRKILNEECYSYINHILKLLKSNIPKNNVSNYSNSNTYTKNTSSKSSPSGCSKAIMILLAIGLIQSILGIILSIVLNH